MRAYLINLDRRRDRLDWSEKQLRRHRIAFKRVAAIEGDLAGEFRAAGRPNGNPALRMTSGETGCLLSHLKAWKEFLATGDAYCLVLEDDVIFAPATEAFLNHFSGSGIRADAVRLETYLQKITMRRFPDQNFGSVSLHRLVNANRGAAAYILARDFAARLVNGFDGVPSMPVDRLLFDPISPFFENAKILQAVPALCVQGDRLCAPVSGSIYESDLKSGRASRVRVRRPRSITEKVARETTRIVAQIDNLVGYSEWRSGTVSKVIPFAHDAGHAQQGGFSRPVTGAGQAPSHEAAAF